MEMVPLRGWHRVAIVIVAIHNACWLFLVGRVFIHYPVAAAGFDVVPRMAILVYCVGAFCLSPTAVRVTGWLLGLWGAITLISDAGFMLSPLRHHLTVWRLIEMPVFGLVYMALGIILAREAKSWRKTHSEPTFIPDSTISNYPRG